MVSKALGLGEMTSSISKLKGRKKRMVRDALVVDMVKRGKCLSRDQIQWLLFPMVSGATKARQRLAALVKERKLKRCRCDSTLSYVYYAREKPKQIDHTLLVNWVWVVAARRYSLKAWIPDYIATGLRADALMVIEDGGKIKPFFVEAQRMVNASRFDKVEKYTNLFKSGSWCDQWWVQQTPEGRPRFPPILTLVDGGSLHRDRLEEIILVGNKAGLRFIVLTIEELLEGSKGL